MDIIKKNYSSLNLKNLVIIGLFLSLVGCADTFDTSYFDKEINDPTIGVALKLGNATYTAKELFEEIDKDIEVSETFSQGKSLVSFVYTETIKENNINDFLTLSNKDSEEKFYLTVFPNGTKGTYIGPDLVLEDSKSVFSELRPDNDAKLTEISFSEGTFQVFLTSKIDSDLQIEFTLNSFVKDGKPFVQTFNLPKGQLTPISSSPKKLGGYTVNLANGTNGYNTLATNIKARIVAKNGDTFTDASSLSYTIKFRNIKIKSAKGAFGKETLDVETKEFDLRFYEKLTEGNISFKSPRLKLKATNGYGFPVGITLEGITTTATTNNQLSILKEDTNIKLRSGTPKTNDYYAIINASETKGIIKKTNIEINERNSNLADLLKEKPQKFIIDVNAISNPNATTNTSNFFDTNASIDIEVQAELPLHVTIKSLRFEPDAFEIDTKDFKDLEKNINTLTLEVFTKNTIPLNGNIKIQFITIKEGIETVEFIKNIENMIDGAPVNRDGFSTNTLATVSENIKKINLTLEEIKKLNKVTHIKAVITFNTTNKEAVKIQSTDIVTFNMALLVDYTFSDKEKSQPLIK